MLKHPLETLPAKQMAAIIGNLDGEISWNIQRLANLVLSDEDRQQTEDYIQELREEKQSLEWCFNNHARND